MVRGQSGLVEHETGARFKEVCGEEGDTGRDTAEHHGEQQTTAANFAETPGTLAEFHGTKHQCGQNQRNGDHKDHAQEYRTDEGEHLGDSPHECHFLGREIVITDQTKGHAKDETQQQLVMLLH